MSERRSKANKKIMASQSADNNSRYRCVGIVGRDYRSVINHIFCIS